MTLSNQNLAALIGSRICHDLISPIGAIQNGMELLEMTLGNTGPEMALISESCANANARIKYFRMAYGAASLDQMVSMREVQSILSDVSSGGRLQYDWQPAEDLPRIEVQIALLGMQCMETAMHHGGTIGVTFESGRWQINATEGTPVFDAAIWDALEPKNGVVVSPAHVQFALLPNLAATLGRAPMLVGTPPETSLVI